MSGVVVLTPILITAWPMLAAAVASAAVSSGFKVAKVDQGILRTARTVELTMENMDVVAETLSHDDKITVERDGIRVTFSRDARGHFKTCVEGHLPKEELHKIGEDLAGRVVQQYVYRRLHEEMANQGFMTLEEERGPDDAIHLTVRRYE